MVNLLLKFGERRRIRRLDPRTISLRTSNFRIWAVVVPKTVGRRAVLREELELVEDCG